MKNEGVVVLYALLPYLVARLVEISEGPLKMRAQCHYGKIVFTKAGVVRLCIVTQMCRILQLISIYFYLFLLSPSK